MRARPACGSRISLCSARIRSSACAHLFRPGSTDGGDAAEAPAATKPGKRSKRGAEAGEDDDSDDDDDVPMAFVRDNLAYYKSNKDDPHLKLNEEDEDGSEDEDAAAARGRREQVQQRELAKKRDQLAALLARLDRAAS